MRAYVLTTGILFGIVTLAHVWRMIEERPMATVPWYILITVATGALCVLGVAPASTLEAILSVHLDLRGQSPIG